MIKQLISQNFKCFEHQTVNFRKLTVLAGANSSGKSSIIQSLLLIKVTLEKIRQYNILADCSNLGDNFQIPLNGKYALNLGNTIEVLKRSSNTDVIELGLSNSDNATLNFIFNAQTDADDIYSLKLQHQSKYDVAFSELSNEFYYLCAERIGPRLSYDVAQQDFSHVGYHGEYAVQVLAQRKQDPIIDPANRKFQGTEDIKVLSQVRAWMEYLIPGLYLDAAQLEGKLQKAFTRYSESTPTNVGFGISYVLPIVVTCMVAENNSLIIIENPEAHLHPRGQSNIGFFLGRMISSGLQIIIETHSEHVINGIRRAVMPNKNILTEDILINFFNVKEGVNNLTEIEVLKSGDLNLFPRDFFDQSQQDMAELFKIQKLNNG